jgi:hypothetical protein
MRSPDALLEPDKPMIICRNTSFQRAADQFAGSCGAEICKWRRKVNHSLRTSCTERLAASQHLALLHCGNIIYIHFNDEADT